MVARPGHARPADNQHYHGLGNSFYDPVKVMDSTEFKDTIEKLGMDERRAAERLGMSLKMVQNYVRGYIQGRDFKEGELMADSCVAPVPVVLLLRLMLDMQVKPEDLR